ncbi:transcriptional regulator [Devosia yakushimensis]|uniref:Transcriptional regulator n=1 Tax=Devosia yakushimensis TaxID=470028 RepID=A0ABQ5UAR0_9HYPH|nr:transcriptional regulator [Devosia yakushimensis]
MTSRQPPGFLIRRLQQSAVAIFLRELSAAGHDLTPVQYAVLDKVAAKPGMDQATLARLVALDKVTLGGVVDRLLTKGLVARSVNPNDRRARLLALTEAGRDELERCQPAVDRAQQKILAGLSEDEQPQFLRLLTKLVDAKNEDSRAPLI